MPATLVSPVRESATMALPASIDRARLADYVELTKPKIAVMALVTVAVGFLLGAAPAVRFEYLLHTLIGTALVAGGGSALNHALERRADARMHRTQNRPLPAGRMTAAEVTAFGITLATLGVIYLGISLPHPMAAITAAATAILYVLVYTPLKRITAWNTVIGAIPGALPPVIGWTAARGDFGPEAFALFGILFAWQLPHFYSIAWLHRADYARGGMRMLPNVDGPDGRMTGIATVLTACLFTVSAMIPFAVDMVGPVYLVGSIVACVWFTLRCLRFALHRDDMTARSVLRGSLVVLLAVMTLLIADGLIPRMLLA
jgi:heme o synthase